MGTADWFVPIFSGLHNNGFHPSVTFTERGSATVLGPSPTPCSAHIPQWCVTLSCVAKMNIVRFEVHRCTEEHWFPHKLHKLHEAVIMNVSNQNTLIYISAVGNKSVEYVSDKVVLY
jgi:hypothetical protein